MEKAWENKQNLCTSVSRFWKKHTKNWGWERAKKSTNRKFVNWDVSNAKWRLHSETWKAKRHQGLLLAILCVTKFHSDLYSVEAGIMNSFISLLQPSSSFCVSLVAAVFKEKDVLKFLVLSYLASTNWIRVLCFPVLVTIFNNKESLGQDEDSLSQTNYITKRLL